MRLFFMALFSIGIVLFLQVQSVRAESDKMVITNDKDESGVYFDEDVSPDSKEEESDANYDDAEDLYEEKDDSDPVERSNSIYFE